MFFSRMKELSLLLLSLSLILIFARPCQANVILKVMGINPSQEQAQTVSLKAYLPKEAKPDDILDRGDLEVIYDTQQGSYYVYGEYELKPGEVIEREVEIRDIWFVPDKELDSVRSEAEDTFAHLENTDLKERAVFLKDSISSKLNEIVQKQKAPSVNPQRRISDYRDNLSLLESVKADLVLLRSLLAQAKPLSQSAIWKIFAAVVGFLAILALALYLIWHKQLKAISETGTVVKSSPSAEDEIISSEHKAAPEKELQPSDIEDILKEGQDSKEES